MTAKFAVRPSTHGGQGVACATEGEQKIPKIKTKSLNTAPCSALTDVTQIPF